MNAGDKTASSRLFKSQALIYRCYFLVLGFLHDVRGAFPTTFRKIHLAHRGKTPKPKNIPFTVKV